MLRKKILFKYKRLNLEKKVNYLMIINIKINRSMHKKITYRLVDHERWKLFLLC